MNDINNHCYQNNPVGGSSMADQINNSNNNNIFNVGQ